MRSKYKTNIEEVMFKALTEHKINFVFQYPIRIKYGYIVDFYLPESKIIIECDGSKWHQDKKKDNRRDTVLLKRGFMTLRFADVEILNDINDCIKTITQTIERRTK